jgi:hypothetical protein
MARAIATWSQPTEREGGVPFDAATELAGSEIRTSADGGNNWSPPAPIGAADTQFIIDGIAVGSYEFELVHIDTAGRRSAPQLATGSVLGAPLGAGDFAVVIEDS